MKFCKKNGCSLASSLLNDVLKHYLICRCTLAALNSIKAGIASQKIHVLNLALPVAPGFDGADVSRAFVNESLQIPG